MVNKMLHVCFQRLATLHIGVYRGSRQGSSQTKQGNISQSFCPVQDEWVSTDSHGCLKKCVCPLDGTACSLAAACDAEHFVCKEGWQRFSNGQPKCFKPGCPAGSLQAAPGRSVQDGQAYAVCTCSGATQSAPTVRCPA